MSRLAHKLVDESRPDGADLLPLQLIPDAPHAGESLPESPRGVQCRTSGVQRVADLGDIAQHGSRKQIPFCREFTHTDLMRMV